MTESEKQSLYDAIRRNSPDYFKILSQRLDRKRKMIADCIELASISDNTAYKDEINRIYNTCCSLMNETETFLLNYLCLIKHKQHINNGIVKDDEDIQRWIDRLKHFREMVMTGQSNDSIISVLDKNVKKTINQYTIPNKVGRPIGTGKQSFMYNGKEYRTLQECANDYNVSKQAIHKRLKKLNII